ncbi:MAG: hypothetical protein NW205_07990 [Hyphomicrobiaceae bacterium]|nr:hypothetical protein [Hyphomicrobiaceae bacterium]
MTAIESIPFEETMARGSIRQADVARLRAALAADGRIDAEEARRLVLLNQRCPVQEASWSDLYREALTDYLVHQAEPSGYVTAANADWLVDAITAGGSGPLRSEVDLLIAILEAARWSPPSLAAYCLAQVQKAVLTGGGHVRGSLELPPGRIADDEVELVRRIIYAAGGDGNIAVTRLEAEALFAIDECLDPDVVNEAWTELFVKAIANAVLAASGYRVPTREEALRSEAWLEQRGDLAPSALARAVARAGLEGVIAAYRHQSREEASVARLELQRHAMVTGEEISTDDAEWLAARLSRDGRITANEAALAAFLSEDGIALAEPIARALSLKSAAAA